MNILLAGGTGYVGKQMLQALSGEGNLYVMSKYPRNDSQPNVTWLEKDIYNYEDVKSAMTEVDVAVFYLDPTKHSAKLTKASVKDLTLIAADNYGRAAAYCGVKRIIYISGSRYDQITIPRLEAYDVEVQTTSRHAPRPLISAELQVSKYDDVRTAISVQLPYKWTLLQIVDYYMQWLNNTQGTGIRTAKHNADYRVYLNHLKRPLMEFTIAHMEENMVTLHITKGLLVKERSAYKGKLEFRRLKGTSTVIVHLYDYIPRLQWVVYYFIQSPIQSILLKGFDMACRIQHYHHRVASGEDLKYTK